MKYIQIFVFPFSGALFAFLGALQSTVTVIATLLFQAFYRAADKHGKPQDVFIVISFATSAPFVLAL